MQLSVTWRVRWTLSIPISRDPYPSLLLRLDNQQTHEIQAEAKDAKTDTPMKLVQWVRFGGGAFIRFVGVARADAWTQAFPKFRAVRDGVKPRV